MAGRLRERRSKEVWQRSFATPRLREIACFDEISAAATDTPSCGAAWQDTCTTLFITAGNFGFYP
jgi:hypothetical protein